MCEQIRVKLLATLDAHLPISEAILCDRFLSTIADIRMSDYFDGDEPLITMVKTKGKSKLAGRLERIHRRRSRDVPQNNSLGR